MGARPVGKPGGRGTASSHILCDPRARHSEAKPGWTLATVMQARDVRQKGNLGKMRERIGRRIRWERGRMTFVPPDPSSVPAVGPMWSTVLPSFPELEEGSPQFIDKKNEPRVQGTCLGGDLLRTGQEFIC